MKSYWQLKCVWDVSGLCVRTVRTAPSKLTGKRRQRRAFTGHNTSNYRFIWAACKTRIWYAIVWTATSRSISISPTHRLKVIAGFFFSIGCTHSVIISHWRDVVSVWFTIIDVFNRVHIVNRRKRGRTRRFDKNLIKPSISNVPDLAVQKPTESTCVRSLDCRFQSTIGRDSRANKHISCDVFSSYFRRIFFLSLCVF